MIGSCGSKPGQFIEPRAIATAPDARIFVIDKTGRVQRFSPEGEFELQWEMPDNQPGKGQPSGICVDEAGRVFVADTHQHRVIVFDRDGAELFCFGELGTGPGQFLLPTDVAVDRQGFIYVSEYGGSDRISKFDPRGGYLLSFGDLSAGMGALQRPSGLAIDQDNNVWVADTGNHRICCFSPTGELVTTVGWSRDGTEKIRYPRDVVTLGDGTVLVVDRGNNRITCFDPKGRFVGCWGQPGSGENGFNAPLNAAATGKFLCVADARNHRIVLSPWNLILGRANQGAEAGLAVAVEGE